MRADDAYSGRPDIFRPSFEDWIATPDPIPAHVSFTRSTVSTRYARNGYEWDMRGTLFAPARETMLGVGFVLLHGGAAHASRRRAALRPFRLRRRA
jgi:hypothetical protein